MKYLDYIYEFIRANDIIIPANADLVFELVRDPDSGEQCCAYYFANHDTRSVFWLDDFDMNYLITWDEVKGVTEPSHVGLEIEAQYWYIPAVVCVFLSCLLRIGIIVNCSRHAWK